jgi:hypothetical protein
MSKIIVLLRTLNEEIHLPRFLAAYDWADLIIIADGGSTDRTCEIARNTPKVELQHFNVWVENAKGGRRNPEGPHMNFLLEQARYAFPSWIIIDEADSALSPSLRQDGRAILESTAEQFVFAPRMYIFGTDKWFPDLTGGSGYTPEGWTGMWAVRGDVPLAYNQDESWSPDVIQPPQSGWTIRRITYPYALLHYFCLTPEIMARKLALYRSAGMIQKSWTETSGPLVELPEWAYPTYYK